jgi:beta-galactosidase GanA
MKKMKKKLYNFLLACALAALTNSVAASIPQLQKNESSTQLLVDGRPFLMLGGELGNSSASSLVYMEEVWPKLKSMQLNTLLVPVYWELIEPSEGEFDFTLVETLIERARKENLKLVPLWFGSWKNSMSSYAPSWVKRNPQRFPRAADQNGMAQEILTPFAAANLEADRKAFAALMNFIREFDSREQTVIMVQVENEIGMLPSARDHHPLANRAFESPVPAELLLYLQEHKATLEPELLAAWGQSDFHSEGSWAQVFGPGAAAEEIFMAWHFARYADAVTSAGKQEYPLPMFVNAALNRPNVAPGDYPSGGPLPHLMDIWKAAAPAIDLLAPDFYNPRFQYWNDRYARKGNALFIPEIRFDTDVGAKALYAFGHYKALGFSPFSIETGSEAESQALGNSYGLLAQLSGRIAAHRGNTTLKGIWLSKENPQMEFTLGDYQFTARHELTLGWSPGADADEWPEAAALVVQTGEEDFVVAGTGVVLSFDTSDGRAGIDTLSEGEYRGGEWQPGRHLNGDQSHQGRHLRIPNGSWKIQQLRLYRY